MSKFVKRHSLSEYSAIGLWLRLIMLSLAGGLLLVLMLSMAVHYA